MLPLLPHPAASQVERRACDGTVLPEHVPAYGRDSWAHVLPTNTASARVILSSCGCLTMPSYIQPSYVSSCKGSVEKDEGPFHAAPCVCPIEAKEHQQPHLSIQCKHDLRRQRPIGHVGQLQRRTAAESRRCDLSPEAATGRAKESIIALNSCPQQ